MTEGLDLSGVAAIITAVTGFVSVVLTFIVINRVNHVVHLTNSNFSAMQATLDAALQENVDQASREREAAEGRQEP